MLHNVNLILARRSSDRNLTDEGVEKPQIPPARRGRRDDKFAARKRLAIGTVRFACARRLFESGAAETVHAWRFAHR
jgi:hypothetical protein